jgi:hypothetical protein
VKDEPKYIGGMMRCCSESIDALRKHDPKLPEIGTRARCDYCRSTFTFVKGAYGPGWRWEG